MKKLATTIAVGVLVAIAPAVAAAQDGFEGLAKKARRVDGQGLAALFWSQTEDCDGGKGKADDLERRQCLGLRAARRAQLAQESFVIEGGPSALRAGAFDVKAKKLPVAIDACVSCDGGVEVGGEKRLVTGEGKPAVAGGALRAPSLGQVSIALADQAAAEAWKRDGLARLRSEFVIRVPGKLDSWRAGGSSGYGVEVVGYRVWDPCDGRVLAARPPARKVAADRSTCPAEVAPKAAVAVKPVEPAPAPDAIERISSNEINQAMGPIRTAAQACFESYGVAGKALLHISFDRAGKITALEQEGDFTETPTAACIERAARKVVFPTSKKKKATRVSFPIVLE